MPSDATHPTYTLIDSELVKYTALKMVFPGERCRSAAAHAITACRRKGWITGVEVVNKSGKQVIAGNVFVDATGDGDLAARAGAPI